jgi:CheY-like chemotaxis protein
LNKGKGKMETKLHLVNKSRTSKIVGDIIFIHGIGGNNMITWHPKGKKDSYWPAWLGEDFPDTNIWSLHYPGEKTLWTSKGGDMSLSDRSLDVLNNLVNRDIGERPIYFIVHSLGGLLLKQMLRIGHELGNPRWEQFVRNTKVIVFIASPHSGSNLASLASALNIYRPAKITQDLKAHCPHLRELGTWYSQKARNLGIQTYAYFETKKIGPTLVVDPTSADPKVEGCIPIPVDGNHFTICTPATKESPLYIGVKKALQEQFFTKKASKTDSIENAIRPQQFNQDGDTSIQHYSVFISYSSKDEIFAQKLRDDLENNEVSCWFAPEDVESGKKLHKQVDKAIRTYDRLLLILSEASMNSEWVKTEIAKARKREVNEKRQILFPISLVEYHKIREWECFDEYTGKDSAKEIREYFIPDFSNWQNQTAYNKTWKRLLKSLKINSTSRVEKLKDVQVVQKMEFVTHHPIKVLLADDALINRQGIRALFESVEDILVIDEVQTPQGVNGKIKTHQPDVLIVDLKWFGNEDAGKDIIKNVRRIDSTIKIIAITAYEKLIKEARDAGADACLTRNFTKAEITSMIREIILMD